MRIGLAPEQYYAPGAYAYVQNGKWISRGNVGWFGTSINDKPEYDWQLELVAYINSLDDDAVLISVDCHI